MNDIIIELHTDELGQVSIQNGADDLRFIEYSILPPRVVKRDV